jgi:hypothetical protein
MNWVFMKQNQWRICVRVARSDSASYSDRTVSAYPYPGFCCPWFGCLGSFIIELFYPLGGGGAIFQRIIGLRTYQDSGYVFKLTNRSSPVFLQWVPFIDQPTVREIMKDYAINQKTGCVE